MTFETWFSQISPTISLHSAHSVLKLAEDGATIPFMARYRKEQTGGLDEVAIQTILDSKERFDTITQRQQHILGEIEKQQKLTPELKEKILATFKSEELEDLYLPYKIKRRSKAQLAREAGLEPLADWIWNCGHGTETPLPGQTLEIWAFTFRNELKGFADAESAINGASDILIERISEKLELRQTVRTAYFEKGQVRTTKGDKAKPNSKFENYFDHYEPVTALRLPQNSHRYLAMRRGWMEEELVLSLGGVPDDKEFEAELLRAFEAEACSVPDSVGAQTLAKVARMALKAHVIPSIENEVHKSLREVADEAAIHVFAENVRKLLLSAPYGPKSVLGVDPGIRTGCKLAVVDDSGKYLASSVIYLQTEDQKNKAKDLLGEVLSTGMIRAIAVGNGTAGRETESYLRALVKEKSWTIPIVMVSEAGASIYSASEAARDEFPDLDVTVRGAISIARRLQDPLAELVKIDPKSIGVGQYQHDVSQPALKRSLDLVVDSCVNQVGVNLNTASYHLLAHVSGIGPGLAKAITEYRGAHGLFKSRAELLEVPRFSKKAFEQAAGFLRIAGAANPLDNTGVHPERYPVLTGLADSMKCTVGDLMGEGVAKLKAQTQLREEVGEFTFDDIIRELEKPGRDPREEFVPFQFRDDIHAVKDLEAGMICPGIVTNVTNFGAFVDIGVHQDGLVHISQISARFIKDPREAVSPGDRVQVKVLEVNKDKNQISLSIKAAQEAPREGRTKRERGPREPRGAENTAGDRKPPRTPREPRQRPPEPKRALKPSNNPPPIEPVSKAQSVIQANNRPKATPKSAPKPKEAFNNAFAGLAGLRDNLKKN